MKITQRNRNTQLAPHAQPSVCVDIIVANGREERGEEGCKESVYMEGLGRKGGW